jgi:hypothetical protein
MVRPVGITININGPNGGAGQFANKAAAIAFARKLDAADVDWDGKVPRINRRQFDCHHLTVETPFDTQTTSFSG